MKVRDTARAQLRDVAKAEGEAFVYEYDMGDSWCHQVLLEEVRFDKSADRVAVCLEGELACPLEDSGGIQGYYDTLEILRDPQHEQYEVTMRRLTRSMASEPRYRAYAIGYFRPRAPSRNVTSGAIREHAARYRSMNRGEQTSFSEKVSRS
jgi:hypothetical protein